MLGLVRSPSFIRPRTRRDSGPLNWNGRRVGAISLTKRGSKRLPVETHGLDHGVNRLALRQTKRFDRPPRQTRQDRLPAAIETHIQDGSALRTELSNDSAQHI